MTLGDRTMTLARVGTEKCRVKRIFQSLKSSKKMEGVEYGHHADLI